MGGLCLKLRVCKHFLRTISERWKEEEDMNGHYGRRLNHAMILLALAFLGLGCVGMILKPGEATAESAATGAPSTAARKPEGAEQPVERQSSW